MEEYIVRILDKTNMAVEFYTIKVGDCFYYDNCLFIKINPIDKLCHDRVANAFCFADNNITHVPNDWKVTPVDAEIVVHNKGV